MLNAATWERLATAEIARAVRTRSALAMALLDIDRFKVINDTYGHLVGDQVLKEIARTLTGQLRDYDLAGRFGGEEFSLLLPQTRAVDAIRIAERIRSGIAGLSVIAPGATGGERVQVTVSIGVAALDSGSERKFPQLMAAADAAHVPGQEQRPGSGADDQHHQGPECGQRHRANDPNGAARDGLESDGQLPPGPSVFHRAVTTLAGRATQP